MYIHMYEYNKIRIYMHIYVYTCIKQLNNTGEVFERARRREWCIGWFGERKRKRENDVIIF